MKNIKYILAGMFFGVILVKAEVISWFRIQEMFLFQAFHMYGVIGSAIATGMLSIWVLKKLKSKTIDGEEITITKKPTMPKAQLFGGIIFGLGWAMTGACPGPLYSLVGVGHYTMLIAIGSALFGTYVYGMVKAKLPH